MRRLLPTARSFLIHSGQIAGFAFVPEVREFFKGIVVLGGGIGTGRAIRSAEILGADLAYLGTRFIASAESIADPRYKQMLVDSLKLCR